MYLIKQLILQWKIIVLFLCKETCQHILLQREPQRYRLGLCCDGVDNSTPTAAKHKTDTAYSDIPHVI